MMFLLIHHTKIFLDYDDFFSNYQHYCKCRRWILKHLQIYNECGNNLQPRYLREINYYLDHCLTKDTDIKLCSEKE